MRLLFATDLHGRLASYRELFARARELEVQAVLLGGDLCPHASGRGLAPIERQRRFLLEELRPELAGLRSLAPLYGLLGNDDWAEVQSALELLEAEDLFRPLHLRVHDLGADLSVAGYSCIPVPPFRMSDWSRWDSPSWEPPRPPSAPLLSTPTGVREADLAELRARPTIEEDLRALAALSAPARTVYVIHTPPADTALDRMHGGRAIGSPALRRWIDLHQPPLTLHGHVHESPSVTGQIAQRFGATLSVNPGDSRSRLRSALVDLTRGHASIPS
ncbi:MAG: metallophosphoesterase [Planctomycetota bacterium]